MDTTTPLILATVLCAGLSLNASQTTAGAAELEGGGRLIHYEYRGQKLRVNIAEEQGYLLLTHDTLYLIKTRGAKLQVHDASRIIPRFEPILSAAAPAFVNSQRVSLKATSGSEQHAGISGEVYEIQYIDGRSGEQHNTQLVLSADHRGIEFRDALHRLTLHLARQANKAVALNNDLYRQLLALDRGVLR